ncbi:Uncharacterised protein [Mycobacteroides abscessus subsp. massiliense]|nr:Uncharacterised protein [Mycobacteroides abscessus subsp. massiliense]
MGSMLTPHENWPSGCAQISSGYVGQYAKEYAERLDALADEQCRYCDSTGIREGQRCNVCRGDGKVRPSETWYPFSEENVREFAEFLEGCGGFEIC